MGKERYLRGLEIDWGVYEGLALSKGMKPDEAKYMRLRLSGVRSDMAEREVGWRKGDGVILESTERYQRVIDLIGQIKEREVKVRLGIYESELLNEISDSLGEGFERLWEEVEERMGDKIDHDVMREYRKLVDSWYRHRTGMIRMVLSHAEQLRRAARRVYYDGEYVGRRTVLRNEQRASIEDDMMKYGRNDDDQAWATRLSKAIEEGDMDTIKSLAELADGD